MTLAGAAVTIGLALLAAQGPRAGAAKRKKAAPAVAVERRAPARTRAPAAVPAPRRTEAAASTASAGSAPSAGTSAESASSDAADSAPTTAGGKTTKTKVYTFGAMDVEGKLKTPQLLYFLNRVKLELEMSAPDHRSFMKELERTADDPSL